MGFCLTRYIVRNNSDWQNKLEYMLVKLGFQGKVFSKNKTDDITIKKIFISFQSRLFCSLERMRRTNRETK